MTSAEFKTIRESCGLPVQWLADRLGVRRRSVDYWETGEFSVKRDAAALVTNIDLILETCVKNALAVVAEQTESQGNPPKSVNLVRYRTDDDLWRSRPDFGELRIPATAHAAMLSRLSHRLADMGIRCRIEWAVME